MAAKDMVDRLTGWMEDTAEMQTESMLELADAIRDEMGSEASEAFTSLVKPALESMYGVVVVLESGGVERVASVFAMSHEVGHTLHEAMLKRRAEEEDEGEEDEGEEDEKARRTKARRTKARRTKARKTKTLKRLPPWCTRTRRAASMPRSTVFVTLRYNVF